MPGLDPHLPSGLLDVATGVVDALPPISTNALPQGKLNVHPPPATIGQAYAAIAH